MNTYLTKIVIEKDNMNEDNCTKENLNIRDNMLEMYNIKITVRFLKIVYISDDDV